MRLPWLDANNPRQAFPDPIHALQEPNGLLALGGCLSVERLLHAYQRGIFPWFSEGDPICWWSPQPRTVLFPEQFKCSRSLRKTLRKKMFQISADRDFDQVMQACAAPAKGRRETWITDSMLTAYSKLHAAGYAHSIEVTHNKQIVGGLYGVAIGKVFFGESMFSHASDASKIALAALCAQLAQWQFCMIDCQMPTAHLHSLGAQDVTRHQFMRLLNACRGDHIDGPWQLESELLNRYF